MKESRSRIILHNKIIKKIIETCAPRNSGITFTIDLLLEKLENYLNYNPNHPIATTWKAKFQTGKKEVVSTDMLEDALSVDRPRSGATIGLADLLCYYAYGKGFSAILNRLGTSLEKEKKRSKEQKKKYLNEKKGNKIFNPKIQKVNNNLNLEFRILILPFRNPEDNTTSMVGRELQLRLLEKNVEDNFNFIIDYRPDLNSNITFSEAKQIGKKSSADMVIWGNDSKIENNPSHHIYFHYVVSEAVSIPCELKLKTKTEKYETQRITEITAGRLQLEIEDIILWVFATKLRMVGDFTNALANYKKISRVKSVNDDIYYCMGICSMMLKLYSEADQFFQDALAINSENSTIQSGYATFLYIIRKEKENSKAHFLKALRIEPESATLNSNYAIFLESAFNDFENANVYHEIATKIRPLCVSAHSNFAIFYEHENDIDKAKLFHERATKIKPPNSYAHSNYAVFLRQTCNDISGALKHYEIATKIEPPLHSAHYNYAELLQWDLFKYEKAIYHYRKSLLIDINFAPAHYGLAAAFAMGFSDFSNAEIHFKAALALDSENAHALYLYASMLIESFRYKEANEYLLKALSLEPKNAIICSKYAELLSLETEFKDIKKASQFYLDALHYSPNDQVILYNYATFLFNLGKYVEASQQYAFLLKINPNHPQGLFNISVLFKAFNEQELAEKYYLKSIHLQPNLKDSFIEEFIGLKK